MNPVRFAVLAVVTLKITEDVTPCSVVDICQCLEEATASNIRVDDGEVYSSET
jgi:hypothetical protein